MNTLIKFVVNVVVVAVFLVLVGLAMNVITTLVNIVIGSTRSLKLRFAR
jgi:hypothetical protein